MELEFVPPLRPRGSTPTTKFLVPIPLERPRELPENDVAVWATASNGHRFPLAIHRAGQLELAFNWPDWVHFIRTEQYATWRRRPLFTRFPMSYHLVPAKVRHALAKQMCKRRESSSNQFPASLFDGGFEALRDMIGGHGLVSCDVSREKSSTPPPAPRICLTHDVDSAEGMKRVASLAAVEQSLGVRSCWNFVVGEYALGHKLLNTLCTDGHEIGLHDYYHDNRTIYLPESELRARLDRCRPFMEQYSVKGFRSPSWFRSPTMLRVLHDYVLYDTSCLDFDWLCPAGKGGVLSPHPFSMDGLIEIPTTLPFEYPLLLDVDPHLIPAYWEPKVEWLAAVGGQVVVNTHPESHYCGSPLMLRAYARFLEDLLYKLNGAWSLPNALAAEVGSNA